MSLKVSQENEDWVNSQEHKTIQYHNNNRKGFTKKGAVSHSYPLQFLQPRPCPSLPLSPVGFISCLLCAVSHGGFSVSPSDSFSIPVATGGGAESRPVLRYSKEQRPTTLPIQPFVFQHHFPKQLAKARALHSLSQLYSLSGCGRAQQPAPLAVPTAQVPASAPSGESQASTNRGAKKAGPEPETSRPSPLGSYSPIRSAGPFGPSSDSSASTLCSPPPGQVTATESPPPWSLSCLPAVQSATSQQPQKEDQKRLTLAEYRLHETGSLPPLGSWRSSLSRAESLARGGGEGSMASRPSNGMSFTALTPIPSTEFSF